MKTNLLFNISLIVISLGYIGSMEAQTLKDVEYITSQINNTTGTVANKNLTITEIYSKSDKNGSLKISSCRYRTKSGSYKFIIADCLGQKYLMIDDNMSSISELIFSLKKQKPRLLTNDDVIKIFRSLTAGNTVLYKYDSDLFCSKKIYESFEGEWFPKGYASMKAETLTQVLQHKPVKNLPLAGIYNIVSCERQFTGGIVDAEEDNLSVEPIETGDINKKLKFPLQLYYIRMAGTSTALVSFDILIVYKGNFIICNNRDYTTWIAILLYINKQSGNVLSNYELIKLFNKINPYWDNTWFTRISNGVKCENVMYFYARNRQNSGQ